MEEAMYMGNMLRFLGVTMKGIMELCGDNLVVIISSTNSDSEPKKKHVEISYKKLRESAAAGIVNYIKVCMAVNQFNILTNSKLAGTMGIFSNASYEVNWG